MNSREDRWRQRLVFAAIVPEHRGFGGPEEEYWHEGKEEPEQDAVVERRHRWLRVRQRGAAPAVQGVYPLLFQSACMFIDFKLLQGGVHMHIRDQGTYSLLGPQILDRGSLPLSAHGIAAVYWQCPVLRIQLQQVDQSHAAASAARSDIPAVYVSSYAKRTIANSWVGEAHTCILASSSSPSCNCGPTEQCNHVGAAPEPESSSSSPSPPLLERCVGFFRLCSTEAMRGYSCVLSASSCPE